MSELVLYWHCGPSGILYGLRLPASASCLGRHSHLAGRGPNNSSLFPPLAAVVAVAAEVVAYYLCKWLDSLMCKGSKH